MTQVEAAGRTAAPIGIIVLLGLLTALGPLAIDMYLPALPQIARDLHSNEGASAWTVSVFFLGMAVGQLFHGPLSDRIGRRAPLIGGVALFVAASAGCALSTSLDMLMAMRFLQAIGGCAGVVVARAIVRDRFQPHEMVRIFAALTLIMGISPIFSPLLGGFILLVGDWRTIFWLLAGLGALLCLAIFFALPESRSKETAALARDEHPFRAYRALITNRHVIGFVLIGAFNGSAMGTYVATSPALVIGTYGIDPQMFGWVFGINGLGLIASSQVSAWLSRRFRPGTVLKAVNRVTVLIAGVMLANAVTGFGGMWGVLIPLFFVVTSLGFSQPNALAGALAEAPLRAGSASALLGASHFAISALCSTLASALHDGTARPTAGVIFVVCLIAMLLFLLIRPGEHRQG